MVIWLTGLSASGKSTIATALCNKFKEKNIKVENLDGDNLRTIFPNTGFSKYERQAHIKRAGYIASLLEKHGVCVIASFISPYEESREYVRSICKDYVEVFLSTPYEVCESRDPKGLYKKVKSGELKNFTGFDAPYEAPKHPEIKIDNSNLSIDETIKIILEHPVLRIFFHD